jgi:N-acetylmuramoyl-L-alanine amidase
MPAVCVFCGSSTGARPAYVQAARDLGAQLARRRLRLVYGAANCGLMAAVADAVARRENRADAVNGVELGDKSDAVTAILVSLSQREMRERSKAFAKLVLREGEGRVRFHSDPEREAAFVVLKSLDLPSALIEAGYISSLGDARALGNPGWRKGFAKALASAIEIYLARTTVATAVP